MRAFKLFHVLLGSVAAVDAADPVRRAFATDDAPLPSGVEPWTGRPRKKADAERLKDIEADMSEEEIVRRYRAFG